MSKWLSTPSKTLMVLLITLSLSACDKGKKPYEEAEKLFNSSDYAAAKSKAVDVVQNAPKSKYIAQAKALYERIEKIENSLKTAEEAVKSTEYKAAIKGYEDVLALDNKNQKAIKALQEVKEVYRNGLMEDATLLYVDNGDYEKGIASYKEVLTYFPGDKTATEALQSAETTFARLRQIGDSAMEHFRIYTQTRGTRNYEAAEAARIRYLEGAKVLCKMHGGRQYLALRLKEYQTEVETALNDFLSKGKAAQRPGSSDQRVLAADDYNRALASFVANYGRPEAWLESDAREALKDKDVSNWIPVDTGRRNLFDAAYSGNINRVRTLIASGIDVNVKDEDGWTALTWAANKGHIEIAKLLIDKGATVDAKTTAGFTALKLVANASKAKEGHFEIVKLLIEKGANVNAKDKDGWTALMGAARNGHMEMAKLLIEIGADQKVKDNTGYTLLMAASSGGATELVNMLIANGADTNASDKDGNTPLRYAAANNRTEIAKILIEKGAGIDAKDNTGKTPLKWAIEKNHKAVAELLRNYGAKE